MEGVIEEQLYTEDQKLEQLKQYQREIMTKCKTIALCDMLFHPFKTDTKTMNKILKNKLIENVKELMKKPEEDINKKFNEIVCEYIQDTKEDISTYFKDN